MERRMQQLMEDATQAVSQSVDGIQKQIDTIWKDNLIVPELIGSQSDCKFTNLKAYLVSHIHDQDHLEQWQKELKQSIQTDNYLTNQRILKLNEEMENRFTNEVQKAIDECKAEIKDQVANANNQH